jgi:hypothetical protein
MPANRTAIGTFFFAAVFATALSGCGASIGATRAASRTPPPAEVQDFTPAETKMVEAKAPKGKMELAAEAGGATAQATQTVAFRSLARAHRTDDCGR